MILLLLAGCSTEMGPPRTAWASQRVIATNDRGLQYSPVVARPAVDGELFVAWRAHEDLYAPSPSEVWAATRRPDLTWTSPERLDVDEDGPPIGFDRSVDLAVDRQGRAHVVWRRWNAGESSLRAVRYEEGRWTSPIPVPGSDGASTLALCAGPNEGVTLVWATLAGVHSAAYAASSGWSLPQLVAATAERPQVVAAAANAQTTAAAWVIVTGGFRGYYFSRAFATLRQEGGWEPAMTLAESGIIASMSLAFHPSGAAVALWSEGPSGPYGGLNSVRSATAPPEQTWGASRSLEGTSGGMGTSLRSGEPVAATASDHGLLLRRFDGGWNQPVRAAFGATDIREPVVAVDGRGRVFAAWEKARGRASALELWALSPADTADRPFLVNPGGQDVPCRRLLSARAITPTSTDSGTLVWGDYEECDGRVATLWERHYSPLVTSP